jgi:hypothetical protein
LDIFVGPNQDLAQFVAEISPVLGLSFQRVAASNGDEVFEHRNPEYRVTVVSHELEDDGPLAFSAFPMQISVSVLNVWDASQRENKLADLSRELFAKLKRTNRYSLMLVDNLQHCIETAWPQVARTG